MNLLLLIGAPLLTAVAVLLSRNQQQVRWISLAGSVVQMGLAVILLLAFRQETAAGNTEQVFLK